MYRSLIAAAGLGTRLQDLGGKRNKSGKLRTLPKMFLPGPVLGEFTAAVRFNADGAAQLFETLEKHAWERGVQGCLADVFRAMHRRWELAFHLSRDRRRVEVDFPCDLTRARQLYAEHHPESRRTA